MLTLNKETFYKLSGLLLLCCALSDTEYTSMGETYTGSDVPDSIYMNQPLTRTLKWLLFFISSKRSDGHGSNGSDECQNKQTVGDKTKKKMNVSER